MRMTCKSFLAFLRIAFTALALPTSGGPYSNSTIRAASKQSGRNCSSKEPLSGQPSAFTSSSSAKDRSFFSFGYAEADGVVANKPSTTLLPSIHWDVDTKSTDNLKPVPPGEGSQLFYGKSDSSTAGQFAFLTLYFTSQSVNLDNYEYAVVTNEDSTSLTVDFGSKEAFTRAAETWSAGEGLILITYSKGCDSYEEGERCYFKVSGLSPDSSAGSWRIVAQGQYTSVDHVTSGGETQWGWWTPRGENDAREPREETTQPTFRILDSRPLSHKGGASETYRDGPSSSLGPKRSDARARGLSSDVETHLNVEAASRSFAPRSIKRHRGGNIAKRWFWDVIRKTVKSWSRVDVGIEKKQLTWAVPGQAERYPTASELQDDESQEIAAPWQNATLMESFGSVDGDSGFMNIFCVDCGTFGNATFAGRASWNLVDGITEGNVELHADMMISLKIGIEAQMSHEADFSTNVFRAGLPGLSYGIVTIGPQVSVSVQAELQATAKGMLLVGAEMGFRDARILLDLVDSASAGSKSSGLEPFFEPTWEAEGDLALSATLALPVGLEFGLQVGSWHKSVAVIDEPSIKATAGASGNASLTDHVGLNEMDGCNGLRAQLSLRNKLFINVLDLEEYPLHDTGEHELARECIQ